MYPKNGHSHPALSKCEPDAWLHGETETDEHDFYV